MFFHSICTSAYVSLCFLPVALPIFHTQRLAWLCIINCVFHPCWRCLLAHTVLKLVSHFHATCLETTSTPDNHSMLCVLSLKPAIWTLELNSLLLCYFTYWLCKCSVFHRNIILLRMTKPLKTSYPLNHCVYLYGIPILCAIYLD